MLKSIPRDDHSTPHPLIFVHLWPFYRYPRISQKSHELQHRHCHIPSQVPLRFRLFSYQAIYSWYYSTGQARGIPDTAVDPSQSITLRQQPWSPGKSQTGIQIDRYSTTNPHTHARTQTLTLQPNCMKVTPLPCLPDLPDLPDNDYNDNEDEALPSTCGSSIHTAHIDCGTYSSKKRVCSALQDHTLHTYCIPRTPSLQYPPEPQIPRA